jgi:hypothetical protein
MRRPPFFQYIRSWITSPSGSANRKGLIILLSIIVISAGSCYNDSPEDKSQYALSFLGSKLNSEDPGNLENLEEPEIPESADIPGRPVRSDGAITIDFNVPSMHNAEIYGFIFDASGAFMGEIGYNETKNLHNGKKTVTAHHAASTYSSITTYAADIFSGGVYTIHGKLDLHSDGFDAAQGDKGFRVSFTVNGNTTVKITEKNITTPCFEVITSTDRPDLKFATIYAYIYFPGGDPLRYYAYRFDGGASYVKLNGNGNDLGNIMGHDLNSGVYDVLIIADMDDSINDPDEPALSNGDKFIVVKRMAINGIDPIDISDYIFTTFFSELLPAPELQLEINLNAMGITFKNIPGAASYKVYGRSDTGYSLIGTIVDDKSGSTYYYDFGPNNEYEKYGLPSSSNFYYRVSAVNRKGVEGQSGRWSAIKSGGVQIPAIFGDRTISPAQLDLLVSIPEYCSEIEITAMSASCGGPPIGTYKFTIPGDQRGREHYFSLNDFSMTDGTAYAFSVRGMDLYGDWSDPSACYLFVYRP